MKIYCLQSCALEVLPSSLLREKMMKTMNYDSYFYSGSNNLQRNLPSSEIQKKTMSSIVSKAPLNNRAGSASREREERRVPSSNTMYSNMSKIPSSPRLNEREGNYSQGGSYQYKNFDPFNMNGKHFPPSRLVKQSGRSVNSNDSGSEIEGYNRLQHLSPHVQLKPINKTESFDKQINQYNQQDVRINDESRHQPQQPSQLQPQQQTPPQIVVNRNYLTKMKRKHKNKITANVSGTKFDLGETF